MARVHLDIAEGAPITVDIKGMASTVLPGQTLAVRNLLILVTPY